MAVERVTDILRAADKEKCGVISFAAFNLESISWVLEVAEEEKTPVLLMEYPTYNTMMPFSTFSAVVKDLAVKARVPVGIMLDHGPSFETAMAAVAGGFTSVMVDFSGESYEENVRKTREVVRACHAMGIDVEGEVGRVGDADTESDYLSSDNYTDPKVAVDYLEKTGVDQLAVAIGTAHGNYVSEPHLDIERLKLLNAATDTPLVLHGGSGVPDDQLRAAFQNGVNKLNIATHYNQIMYDAVADVIRGGKSATPRISDCMKAAKPAAQEFIRHLIRLGNGK